MQKLAGSTVPSRTSTASAALSDTEFVKRQLKMLAGNYANSPLSADDATTTELYRDELAAMADQCGQERVAASVRAAIRGCKFLPEISVLWDGIPPAGSRLAWDPNCAVCHGMGWRMVREGPGKLEKATRCNCLALRKVS